MSKLHTPFGDTPPPQKARYVKAPHAYEFASQNIPPGTSIKDIVMSFLAPPGEDGWMVAATLPQEDGSTEILLQRLNVIRPDPGSIQMPPGLVVPG